MKIVISADASDEGAAACEWCLDHMEPGDEAVAVIGVDPLGEVMLSVSPLVGMVDEGRLRADTEQALERIGGLRATTRLVNHSQHRAVLDVARDEHADLIVVGKRPHHGVTDTLLNETAARLIHHAPCPVLVVPTTYDRTRARDVRKHPVDA